MDSIVEQAEVSKGGFYVHFALKDALLTEMITEYVDKLGLSYQSFMKSFSDEVCASDVILALVDKIADTMEQIGYELMKLAYRMSNSSLFCGDLPMNGASDTPILI